MELSYLEWESLQPPTDDVTITLFRQKMRQSGDSMLCRLAGLKWHLSILEDNILEMVLNGQMLGASACDEV